jgi:hypothetical protein
MGTDRRKGFGLGALEQGDREITVVVDNRPCGVRGGH